MPYIESKKGRAFPFDGSMQDGKPETLYRPWEEARPYAESLMNKTLAGETVLEADRRYKPQSWQPVAKSFQPVD
jgi:hypothetical protein